MHVTVRQTFSRAAEHRAERLRAAGRGAAAADRAARRRVRHAQRRGAECAFAVSELCAVSFLALSCRSLASTACTTARRRVRFSPFCRAPSVLQLLVLCYHAARWRVRHNGEAPSARFTASEPCASLCFALSCRSLAGSACTTARRRVRLILHKRMIAALIAPLVCSTTGTIVARMRACMYCELNLADDLELASG
jgi:hypothetical protein